MTEPLLCTDEELNRLLDDELSGAERRRLLRLVEADPVLAARLRGLRRVDEVLRETYAEVEPLYLERPQGPRRNRVRQVATAAALFLPLGFLAGWLAAPSLPPRGPSQAAAGAPQTQPTAIGTLFHIAVDDTRAMEAILDRAEALLAEHGRQGRPVEVVANAGGLNFLRAGTSAFAERIGGLLARYPNLSLVACANTIKRFQERGEQVVLINQAKTDATAIDHIVHRLRQGWIYVEI